MTGLAISWWSAPGRVILPPHGLRPGHLLVVGGGPVGVEAPFSALR